MNEKAVSKSRTFDSHGRCNHFKKSTMKKFELILGLLAILGIILKLLDIPGNGILTVLVLCTLSMLYFFFGFALFNDIRLRDIFKNASYKDTNAKRIIGAIGLGFALSLVTIGGLYKLQFWPGASMQLMVGLAITGLIMLIAAIFYFRNKADYYTRVFKRIAIYGGLGLVLYLTPSNTLVDVFHGANPEYADLFKKVLADPENLELREQLQMKEREMYDQEFQEEE